MKYSFLIILLFAVLISSCKKTYKDGFDRIEIDWPDKPKYITFSYLDSIYFSPEYYTTPIISNNLNRSNLLRNEVFYYQYLIDNTFYNDITKFYSFQEINHNNNLDTNYYQIYEYHRNKEEPYLVYIKTFRSKFTDSPKAIYWLWDATTMYDTPMSGLRPYQYLSEISKKTPRIITNLPEPVIRRIFPMFKGIYIYKNYKNIIIDFSYPKDSDTFYKNISFVE